jgi:ParB/RepB/Spo0J family partition protein
MATKNPRKDKEVKRRDLYSTDELNKIRIVPGLNVRQDLPDIPELVEMIKASGRITPLLVRRNPDPDVEATWDLIGGHRRLEAAKRLKDEGWEGKVTLEEVTCTEEEMVVLMALDNMGRKDFSAVEEAKVAGRLVRMNWTDSQISERMGFSIPWVLERKVIYTAAPVVKDDVKGGLSASVGAEIAKSGDNKKQAQILEDAKAEAKQMAKDAQDPKKKGKGKGRKDWRQNMRNTVSKRTGKKLVPGKKLLRQVKDELLEAKVLNGSSKKALLIFDFAMGEVTVEQFRDQMGYEMEDEA